MGWISRFAFRVCGLHAIPSLESTPRVRMNVNTSYTFAEIHIQGHRQSRHSGMEIGRAWFDIYTWAVALVVDIMRCVMVWKVKNGNPILSV